MKSLLIVFFVAVSLSDAVKPRRFFNSKFQRLEEASSTTSSVPHTIYGPPPVPVPAPEYGVPTTTESSSNETMTTTEIPTTTERFSESVNSTAAAGKKSGRLTKGQQNGLYYIYHPNGQLQKVVYSTRRDAKTMGLLKAELKYENVEPITAPVYTYDPETLVLTRFQQK